jgi:signal peptidase II
VKLPSLKGKNLILALTVPICVIADQVTKALAASYLKPIAFEASPADRYVTVIEGFWRFKYTENAGAAWGLFRDSSASFRIPFFIIVSLAAIGFILWFFKKLEPRQKLLPLAVSLVLGGAIGNLIDRVIMGKVIDFIDWYLVFDGPVDLGLFTITTGEKHWPTFNVADAAISVGVVLLIVEMFVGMKKKPADEAEQEEATPQTEVKTE